MNGDRAAVGMLLGCSALIGAAVYYASPAKADPDPVSIAYASAYAPAVCSTLDTYPSRNGILGIATAIRKQGLTFEQASWVIILSVDEVCPEHMPLLEQFSGVTV